MEGQDSFSTHRCTKEISDSCNRVGEQRMGISASCGSQCRIAFCGFLSSGVIIIKSRPSISWYCLKETILFETTFDCHEECILKPSATMRMKNMMQHCMVLLIPGSRKPSLLLTRYTPQYNFSQKMHILSASKVL